MGQQRRFKVEFETHPDPFHVTANSRRSAVAEAFKMRAEYDDTTPAGGFTGGENFVVLPLALELDRYTVSHTPVGGIATKVDALVTFVESLAVHDHYASQDGSEQL